MKILIFWKPFVWLALICYGLFLPAQNLPAKQLLSIPHFDKIVHFSLFFGLSLLLFNPFKKIKTNYLVLAPVTAVLLGALLELVQHSISSTRSSNIYDFLANSAGIVISIIFYSFFVSGKKWEAIF